MDNLRETAFFFFFFIRQSKKRRGGKGLSTKEKRTVKIFLFKYVAVLLPLSRVGRGAKGHSPLKKGTFY